MSHVLDLIVVGSVMFDEVAFARAVNREYGSWVLNSISEPQNKIPGGPKCLQCMVLVGTANGADIKRLAGAVRVARDEQRELVWGSKLEDLVLQVFWQNESDDGMQTLVLAGSPEQFNEEETRLWVEGFG